MIAVTLLEQYGGMMKNFKKGDLKIINRKVY